MKSTDKRDKIIQQMVDCLRQSDMIKDEVDDYSLKINLLGFGEIYAKNKVAEMFEIDKDYFKEAN